MEKLKQNLIYSIAYQFLILMLPLITAPYLSRVLGLEGIGTYSYHFSIAHYFTLFILLGINNYGSRSIAIVKDDKITLSKTFWEIYSLQFLCGLLMIFIYTLYLAFISHNDTIISKVMILYLMSALFDINWFYFGLEDFKITVIRNTLIKVLSLFAILTLVKYSRDLWLYAVIVSSSMLFSQIILWFFLKSRILLILPSFRNIFKHAKSICILFIPVIAISIYKIMDKIMIGLLSDMNQVGLYENSEKIIMIPTAIITALGVVMLPRITTLITKGETEKTEKILSSSLQFAMFLASGLAFGIAAIAPDFAPMFYGEEFMKCGLIMTLLAPTVLFTSWASVIRTQLLIPVGNDKPYVISVCFGAIANLFANFFLIKEFGAIGAVFGTLLAELIVAIYQTIAVKDQFDVPKMFRKCIVYVIFGFVMFIIVRVIGNVIETSFWGMLFQIFSGMVLYLALSGSYLYNSEEFTFTKLLRK